ncbi:hypothetical protein D3C87_1509470 [compost metagenome]
MPPLRKAMGFIDSDQRQGNGLEGVQDIRLEKGFRCGIKNVDFTGPHIPPERAPLFRREIGIKSLRTHARLTQGSDLIDHQRDERRDDQPHTLACKRWNLVTKRLPTTSRHQNESIIARHHVLDDFGLPPTKHIVAIDGLEDMQGISGHGSFYPNWNDGASSPFWGPWQSRRWNWSWKCVAGLIL